MTQYPTLLSVLVIFTLCKPIVCSNGHFLYDKRDRTPYINSSEYNTQKLQQQLSLIKEKVETSTSKEFRKNETGPAYTVDSKDCLEGDAKSDKPFCTRLRSYPEQSHLEEIIKTKFNNLESLFGEDSLMPQDLNYRFDPGHQFLCHSRARVIYPEAGLNKDYEWMFIINTEKYRQGVRIEECTNEGSVCVSMYPPNNFKATCKQNYLYRSLVAYANGTIVKGQFKMPCCCKCVLTVA